MAYCSYSDVFKIFPEKKVEQLSDPNRDGYPVVKLVDEAIDAAADIIDAYLVSVISLPIASDDITRNPFLKRLNCDLAVCQLYDRGRGAPENWKERCERAYDMLDKITSGELSLNIEQETEEIRTAMQSATRTKIFDTDTMAGY